MWIAAALLLIATIARGQTPTGHVTITADYLPNRSGTGEMRARVFAEEVLDPTPRLVLTLSGFAEGLLARRPAAAPFAADERVNVRDAVLRVHEASVSYTTDRFDLLTGFTRVVWGRLDELQPSDVINPIDVSRFLFEGRSHARLPVAVVRVRAHLAEGASMEGVYVPFSRRGRFDELAERTSPFNLEPMPTAVDVCLPTGCPSLVPISIERHTPPATPGNAQGGARFNATVGRVDWSVSAYRGFEPFGLARFAPLTSQAAIAPVHVVFPRFTMIGGDFETVRGNWGMRGEIAAVVDDNFQHPSLRIVDGRSFDAGIGVDRSAGQYRVSGTVLLHTESYDEPIDGTRRRSDLSLIASTDRRFARDRYEVRTFGVFNAKERSGFLRGITTAKLRDDLALEGSIGWFAGRGRSAIGRFSESDFAYLRLKYFF